jgi:hypothetical protein
VVIALAVGCGPTADDGDGTLSPEMSVDDATAGGDSFGTSTGAEPGTTEPPPLDDATVGQETSSTSTGEVEPDTTGGEEVVDEGLFACGLPSPCSLLSWHLEPWEAEDVACAGELTASAQPGVLYARKDGGDSRSDRLAIVVGNGVVVMHDRSRGCAFDDTCDVQLLPWETNAVVQQCDIADLDALLVACAGDGPCEWMPYWDSLADCVQLPVPTCEEIEALLR